MSLNPSAFLDLSIIRCNRRREAIVAQAALYMALLTFDLIWIYFAQPDRSGGLGTFLMRSDIAWVWPVTAILAVLAVKRRRRLTRELDALERSRVEFTG